MIWDDKLKVEVVIACVVISFATFLLTSEIYRRWKRRRSGASLWYSDPEVKPQSRFKRVLADNSYTPFTHWKCEGKEKESSLKMHPYEREINFLLKHPPLTKFGCSHQNLDMDSSYVWVDTEYMLESLAATLSKEKVFAVDTEQHSIRSFLGFTALMQISTQKEDFLVDTIALHDVMGILRPVFANPSICKVPQPLNSEFHWNSVVKQAMGRIVMGWVTSCEVIVIFHGADNDVLWLQRDFHIYVVNLFDTAKACEVLSKPLKSLAFLLEKYCSVLTDKSFQREDWRRRPLCAEMIQYARTDAHYLLHIADCLASELRTARHDTSDCPDDKFNFFFEASRRSNTICLQLYVKEIELSPGASAAASILSRNWSLEGGLEFKGLETKDLIWKFCAWRDLAARIHDESLRYVLSDQAIVTLALKVPKSPQEIFDVIKQSDLNNCSPSNYLPLPTPSPIVRTHVDEVCFLLRYTNTDVRSVLKRHQKLHLDTNCCCLLRIYSNALLSDVTLIQDAKPFSWQNGGKFYATTIRKASRDLFVQKFSCKSPVYHNCRIYANDGRLLCYCDRRKLEWYLQRDLAKIVEDDPPAIMLLFEPKGRPEDEDNEFYIQSKKNICVGCGEKNHYLRYRIIPSCYRIHFPEHLKSHRSHDIVLVCVDCHERAHAAAEKQKKQIASEFGIPLFIEKIVNSGESTSIMLKQQSMNEDNEKGVPPLQLRTAAMALLRHGSQMPSKRKDELMQTVKAFFGGREVLPEDLETALFVGMSPHERRRLQKKRGIVSKHNKAIVPQRNSSSLIKSTADDAMLENMKDFLEESCEGHDVKEIIFEQKEVSNNGMQIFSLIDAKAPTPRSLQIDEKEFLGRDLCDSSLNNGNSLPEHENVESSQCFKSGQGYSSRRANRLSLLGHGHHGKEVVEQLLKEHGEDGILQFCQKWRQVFVQAVNPRFLPAGWDIMHSGRRDFGEYSVYNPAKKVQQPAAE